MSDIEEFTKFVDGSKGKEAEIDALMEAMKSKAKLVVNKVLDSVTDDELEQIHHALGEVIALYISKNIPFPISIAIERELFEFALLTSSIGYYMGKTGDKLEGV